MRLKYYFMSSWIEWQLFEEYINDVKACGFSHAMFHYGVCFMAVQDLLDNNEKVPVNNCEEVNPIVGSEFTLGLFPPYMRKKSDDEEDAPKVKSESVEKK